jgi:S-adenosyl-L-methionine hydrolase (adenosine-forming)
MAAGGATIALLTDFGSRAPYVAAMKGVIRSRSDAAIVDLTHEVDAFDVFEAAFFLNSVRRYFPADTIFVSVVDPGVGSERKIIAAREERQTFLAPDNGLLSLVLGSAAEVRSVEQSEYFLPDGSRTFHGRDRFAPVAALLAGGLPLERLGPPLALGDLVHFDYEPPVYGRACASGSIVSIDRFGNLISDLEVARLFSLQGAEARAGGHLIRRLVTTYAEAAGTTEPFMIAGSIGTVEISVANGSAADLLQIPRFADIEIQRSRS